MSENKINITSTAIEKGIDLAKEFLDKLITPAVQETGLLISDQISKFRFNNQLRMLVKAREKCIKAGINPQTISFKILCPLLEGASFEEDNEMTEVWASLLSNLVDSEQNIQNHIFPYLLSQISKEEWNALKGSYLAYEMEQKELEKLPDLELKLKTVIQETHQELNKLKEAKSENKLSEKDFKERGRKILERKHKLEGEIRKLKSLKYNEPELNYKLISEDYQYSNLYRLGIINKKPNFYALLEQPQGGLNGEVETRHDYHHDDVYEYHNVKLNLDNVRVHVEEDGDEKYLSELGMIFIKSCL